MHVSQPNKVVEYESNIKKPNSPPVEVSDVMIIALKDFVYYFHMV